MTFFPLPDIFLTLINIFFLKISYRLFALDVISLLLVDPDISCSHGEYTVHLAYRKNQLKDKITAYNNDTIVMAMAECNRSITSQHLPQNC